MDAHTPPPALEPQHPRFQATIKLLKQRLHDYDTERARNRLSHALVRGGAAGLATRGGLHLVTYCLGLLQGKKGRAAGSRPAAAELVKDTLRWGAFLGAFAGSYVFWDEAIALLGGANRTRQWRAFASGVLAGPAILLTGPKARHTSLAIYLLLRGLQVLIRCGNLPDAHPRLRALLTPTRWRHGDVALMCLSTMQIAYSWIIMPQSLPPAYSRFLDKHGGKPPHAYAGVRELARLSAGGRGPFRLASLRGTPHEAYCGTIPCEFWHPGDTCVTHVPSYWPGAYLRALPVYLPVYVVPALFVHGRALLAPRCAPLLWAKLGAGVLRSSLFLGTYCTLAFAGSCVGFRLWGRTNGWVISGSAWVAGLALLLEKKSRRMELSLYVLSRVVEAFAACLVHWGYAGPHALPRRTDVILFSLAAGAILHCYSDYRGARRVAFRSKYLSVFDFILGSRGFQESSISHHPSNADLLSLLERRLLASWWARLLLRRGGKVAAGAGAGPGVGAAQEDPPEEVRGAPPGGRREAAEPAAPVGE